MNSLSLLCLAGCITIMESVVRMLRLPHVWASRPCHSQHSHSQNMITILVGSNLGEVTAFAILIRRSELTVQFMHIIVDVIEIRYPRQLIPHPF